MNLKNWVSRHKAIAVTGGLVSVAAAVTAALLIIQSIAVSPAARAPDVVFEQGADYGTINAAGYATAIIGADGTSATLSLDGIPGADLVHLGDVLALTNNNASLGYNITLARGAAPDAAISGFVINVSDASDALVESYDAAALSNGTAFTLPASTSYDISIEITIAAGTPTGALSGFDLQFEMVPA